MSRPLAHELVDAGVSAMVRAFALAKVEEQVAVLGAIVTNILTIADAAQRDLALENVCICLLASLKSCAERGWALPNHPDWRARISEILMTALVARRPWLQVPQKSPNRSDRALMCLMSPATDNIALQTSPTDE